MSSLRTADEQSEEEKKNFHVHKEPAVYAGDDEGSSYFIRMNSLFELV